MNIRLGPSDSFPDDLAALTDVDLQVLHSRIQCQLDHEYAHEFEANPETEFRHAEIRDEIGHREFSTSTWEPLVRLTTGR